MSLIISDNFQRIALNYTFYIFYLLYFLIAFSLNDNASTYILWINNGFTLYFSLFLILRFNPWRTTKYTDFDRTIAYYAGIQLLLSAVIVQTLTTFLSLKSKLVGDTFHAFRKTYFAKA
jgi:hypothetical protein